jgi:hypothetical protein
MINTTSSPSFTYNSDPAREIGIFVAQSDEVLISNNLIQDERISAANRIVIGTNATNVVIIEP